MSLDLNDRKAVLKEARDDMARSRSEHWKTMPISGVGSTGSKNVIVGTINDKGVKATATYPCHAPIRNFTNSVVMWSAFGYRCPKEVAERYLRWLCYTSPWSMTGIVPEDDFEYMFREGFVFQDLDKTPANLLHNFLIATRMAAEWGPYIEDWCRLVDDGIDPALAYFHLTMFWPVLSKMAQAQSWVSHNTMTWTGMDKYDWPLDVFRASNDYVHNFVYGKTPGLDKKMFSPKCNTVPVNTLWGKVGTGQGEYIRDLKERYKKLFTEERQTTQFGGHIMTIASKKDIMTLLREEESRLDLRQRKAA